MNKIVQLRISHEKMRMIAENAFKRIEKGRIMRKERKTEKITHKESRKMVNYTIPMFTALRDRGTSVTELFEQKKQNIYP